MAKVVNSSRAGRPAYDADLAMDDVLRIIRTAIEEKKGEQVTILDLTGQVDYLDYIVVCSGQTDLHNRAVADQVTAELSRYDIIPDATSGYRNGGWILVDYGVLVVHIMLPPLRDFYRLEELWAAGREVGLS
jgi:ribosome-associated protein